MIITQMGEKLAKFGINKLSIFCIGKPKRSLGTISCELLIASTLTGMNALCRGEFSSCASLGTTYLYYKKVTLIF